MLNQYKLYRNARRVLSNMSVFQWIVVLFIWSLCIQILFNVFVVGLDIPLSGDELDYNDLAVHLVTQNQFVSSSGSRSFRPPAFPVFLAMIYNIFGLENYTSVKLIQAFLGAALCVVLFILAKETFDVKTGLLSGFVASLYPYLVYYSSQLRLEPLYFLCVYSSALFFLKFIKTKQLVFGIITGICWGIAALSRSDWLLTMPFFFIWGLWTLRESKLELLKFSLMFVIVVGMILPWTWRNYLVLDSFVPVSTNLGVTIAGSNNPDIVNDPIMRGQWLPRKEVDVSRFSEVEQNEFWTQSAITFIRQNPLDFLTLGIWRLVRHWHFYYPTTRNSLPEILALLCYFIVLFLAIGGTIRLLKRKQIMGFEIFTFILFLFTNTIAFVIRGGTRYRLLIDPSLIILASYMGVSIQQALCVSKKREQMDTTLDLDF